MLISEHMTPVMYLDPSGESPLLFLVVGLVLFAMYSTSPEIQDYVGSIFEMGEDAIFVDVSLTIAVFQVGFSFVINLEDKYVEIYPHVGICIGCTVSIDLGVIDNYENPGDYRGHFFSASASYWLGIGHSWTPDFENMSLYNKDQARAYYLTISPPGASFSYSYYIWNKGEQIIIDWGS
jgi:hypothetical protein